MNPIKTLGAVLLVALVAMGLAGTGSATANTAFCETDESTCQAGHLLEHQHLFLHIKLLTSFGTVLCQGLTLMEAITSHVLRLSLIAEFTYVECVLGSTKCTATEENGPSKLQVERTGHETATVTGEGLVHLVCGTSLDCSYNGVGLKGTAKGPLLSTEANGEITLSEQATNKETGGFLCPKTAKLDLTSSGLVATYITD